MNLQVPTVSWHFVWEFSREKMLRVGKTALLGELGWKA